MNKSEGYELLLKCLTTCDRCAFECCANTANHAECLKACLTCADVCTICIRVGSRGTKMTEDFLSLCIKACEACAEECEKHDDALCKECADICRKCAEEQKSACKACCK